MVQPNDISWGSYKEYAGPYYLGRDTPYKLPSPASENDKVLATISATEGGSFSACNMYDRMILSVGVIQWGEAGQYSVSDMLGVVAKNPDLLNPLNSALAQAQAVFKPNDKNRYRFFQQGSEVDTLGEQQQLFLQCDGHRDSWSDSSKLYAKTWAACVASVFQQAEAQMAQVSYTVPRLRWFATRDAAAIIFDGAPDTGWVAGLRAAYLSFAANLPAVASKQLLAAVAATTAPKWSQDWCIAVLKQLTFGPNISIYPGRYNKIRPVIEKNWGIDLPDFADELRAWQANQDANIDPPASHEPSFQIVEEIQTLLIFLGYDLGPAGVDGKAGKKTHEAIQTFQRLNGLVPDGLVGPKTRAKMLEAYRAKN